MTRDEIIAQASKLDAESGFYKLNAEESWKAEQLLSPVALNLHRAASYLWMAASKMEAQCANTSTT